MIFEHLLPRSRAWLLSKNKMLTRYIEGLEKGILDARDYASLVYLDLLPFYTRSLEEWENQFNLAPDANLLLDERRLRLDAAWKRTGGQSPKYIQDAIRTAGFDVWIHEWWTPDTNPPVPRNPINYIQSGLIPPQCGEARAVCGEPSAQCTDLNFIPIYSSNVDAGDPRMEAGNLAAEAGNFAVATQGEGYVLVNKLSVTNASNLTSCGDQDAQCGELNAQCGTVYRFAERVYDIPTDPTSWPYFLYFGGETFGTSAFIQATRRNEFENLLLQICPAQQWLALKLIFI